MCFSVCPFNAVVPALLFICISYKEVSIKKSLNYLGVSSSQRESTMKALLCISCNDREVTGIFVCVWGEAYRVHTSQHIYNFKHIVIVLIWM